MTARAFRLVVTCEHAGREVPPELASFFAGQQALLASHRGWDPGALAAARGLAVRLEAPLLYTETTRLVADANRGRKHPRVISELLRALDRPAREALLDRWWAPHREAVMAAIDPEPRPGGVAAGAAALPVLHLAVHTFTPTLDGEVRHADFAPLYDPARPTEVAVARRLIAGVRALAPRLRLRRNYPYRGADDGLTRALRRRLPDSRYAGLELEFNQALLGTPAFEEALAAVGTALAELTALPPAP